MDSDYSETDDANVNFFVRVKNECMCQFMA